MTRYCGNRIFDPNSYPADKMCGKDARFVVRGRSDALDVIFVGPTTIRPKVGEIILYLCAGCRKEWTDGGLSSIEELRA